MASTMHELVRLSQFSENFTKKLSSKKRLEILKNVDVHYYIKDEPHLTPRTRTNLLGTTFLYFAARNSFYECVHELLAQGVDLLRKKMHRDIEDTPLITVLDFYHPKGNSVWKMMGQVKHDMIDILLNAQIKTGNVLNPINTYGVSHFHVACVANHTEAVKFFINAGEDIDQAFNNEHWYLRGYTLLHCAIRYSSIESFQMLVKYGANIYLKDDKDRSSLHLLMERLMHSTDYITMGKQACCLICKEEIKKIESMINFILMNKKAQDTNFTDDTGLTAFHMACALTNKSVAESFLRRNVNVNASINNDATFYPGHTPLHFAACLNIETLKLLVHEGGDITKDAFGKSPLDLCMERYSPEVIHSILSCKSEFKNIILSDGCTNLLEVLLLMNDCDKFNNFLQSTRDVNMSVPHDSPIWPGNTLLHLSILMNEKTKTLKDFYNKLMYKKIPEGSQKFYNCTEKEELVYWKRIVMCLVQGCSLSSKNAAGLSPIHLAFKLRKVNIVDKLLNSCKTDVANSSNLTHFHIACIVGKTSYVEKMLSKGIDVNSPVNCSFEWYSKTDSVRKNKNCMVRLQVNSTPLHSAVIFQNKEIIELLLQNGADVYAQDALGLTPIHHSLNFEEDKFRPTAELLLSSAPNLKEVVSNQNLTHLHVAAYANDVEAIKKLLAAGSDIDMAFDYEGEESKDYDDELEHFADETPLYTAVKSNSGEAVRALIAAGADITKKLDSWYKDTPFVESLDSMDSDSTKHLVQKAKRVYKGINGPISESGVTMLHVACGCFDLMWVKKLLEAGANVNAQIRDDDDCGHDVWRGATPLNTLINETWKKKKLPKNLMNLFKLLLKYGADVTIPDCIHTPLQCAYELSQNKNNENHAIYESIVDLLLKSQISYEVNPTDFDGFSHFHIACIRNNMEIVKRFLDNGVDVNHYIDYFACTTNKKGFTSLHFALHNRHIDLARLLIERGANVKAEARSGDTPLHIAVENNCMDMELLEILHRNGADFNAQNLEDITPLMSLLMSKNFTLEQFDFFLKCESIFDVTHLESCEGIIGLAMKNAASDEREQIFQKLIETPDVKSAIKNGFNAIHSLVSVNQDGRLTLKFYLRAIKQLGDIGCDLNQQNEKGRAPIHDAIYFYNVEAIRALLLLGADLNVVDNKNESPFSTSVIAEDKVPEERRFIVFEILENHAWKIQFLELDMKDTVEKDMLLLTEGSCADCIIKASWKNELKKMEGVVISNFFTVKSFLCGGVFGYKMMVLSQRKLVDDFFDNSHNIIQQFPEFGGLLIMQYEKAVFESKML